MNVNELRDINDYFTVKHLESKIMTDEGNIYLKRISGKDYKDAIEYWENELQQLKIEISKYYK